MPSSEFDQITIDELRQKKGAKWQRYGEEVLPSFVADMDFHLAPAIHAVLSEQLANHDYGYTLQIAERPTYEIYTQWAARRFGWQVDPGRIEGLVDIVQGIYLALHLYSQPGDGIVVLTPTYPPLWKSVETMQRRLIDCPMHPGTERFEIDFEGMRERIDANTKMLLLCNPHNPTGRAFSREELSELGEIALAHDLIVVADEIHADLVFSGHKHIPFASLSPELAARTITMTSATKSFNLGGMRFAIAIFGSQALQDQFNAWPRGAIGGLNSLGVIATETAWSQCDGWLDDLISYLEGNRNYLMAELGKRMPGMDIRIPEATYLAWLGCAGLPLNQAPFEHFLEVAKVAFNPGPDFGSGGDQHVRLNFATSQKILASIIDRMEASVSS